MINSLNKFFLEEKNQKLIILFFVFFPSLLVNHITKTTEILPYGFILFIFLKNKERFKIFFLYFIIFFYCLFIKDFNINNFHRSFFSILNCIIIAYYFINEQDLHVLKKISFISLCIIYFIIFTQIFKLDFFLQELIPRYKLEQVQIQILYPEPSRASTALFFITLINYIFRKEFWLLFFSFFLEFFFIKSFTGVFLWFFLIFFLFLKKLYLTTNNTKIFLLLIILLSILIIKLNFALSDFFFIENFFKISTKLKLLLESVINLDLDTVKRSFIIFSGTRFQNVYFIYNELINTSTGFGFGNEKNTLMYGYIKSLPTISNFLDPIFINDYINQNIRLNSIIFNFIHGLGFFSIFLFLIYFREINYRIYFKDKKNNYLFIILFFLCLFLMLMLDLGDYFHIILLALILNKKIKFKQF
jgi:hypothetical protein